MKKKAYFLVVISFFVILLVAYLAVFGRALGQPENHFGIFLALPKTVFGSDAVRIDDQTYLAKNKASFIKTMERQGFTYVEQIGSGYILKKGNERYLSVSRMYSSYFMVFTDPVSGDGKNIEY
jgi:hypothetical protein